MNKGDLAENVNNFFIDSVNETILSISESQKSLNFSSLPHFMGLEETDGMDAIIMNAINSLKNVSAGIEGIKPQVIKYLRNEL